VGDDRTKTIFDGGEVAHIAADRKCFRHPRKRLADPGRLFDAGKMPPNASD
jgi:hypothetical protein